jgi:hypothetical protein
MRKNMEGGVYGLILNPSPKTELHHEKFSYGIGVSAEIPNNTPTC